ncbi:MAG: hypothetical protein COA52_17630 [Hyphomicrobiales bacterium]|nr:MAG: hypothetical protein COA52_17630 [Hyphomicrobiales bacterium]
MTNELSNSDAKASDAVIEALCTSAKSADNIAAVCVHSNALAVAKQHLAGSAIKLAAILNTEGSEKTLDLEKQAAEAVANGADEIEMVLPSKIFTSGRPGYTETQIIRVKRACGGTPLKIVLETAELDGTTGLKAAAILALEAGADLLKSTSVGDQATTDILLSSITSAGKHAGLRTSATV